MKSDTFTVAASDQLKLHVYEWLPDKQADIKAMVLIAHGMAEHGARYAPFAEFLTQKGYAVFANDHRGHGKTAGDLEHVGFLAPKRGWELLLEDFKRIASTLKEKHPDQDLYLLGHSMGSFIVRTVILDRQLPVKGAIISGTADDPGLLGQAGMLIAGLLKMIYPANPPSPLMDQLSFGAFNKPFKPNRTKFDWLSRNEERVDLYVEDPYCGGVFTSGFFQDMLGGLTFISKQKSINQTPRDLPMLFFSGDQDPVGNQGKGVGKVFNRYQAAGMTQISLKLFEGGRHEMLNEVNRDEVYQLVLDWLNSDS